MREARVGLQRAVLEELRGQRRGVRVGHDLVVVAVHHQHRHRDLLEVLGEVGLREGDDAVVVGLRAAHHALAPPVLDDRFGRLDAGPVEPVERPGRQRTVELRAVGGQLGLQVVEHALRQTAGVRLGLHHQRRHRADQHGLRRRGLAVAGDVVRDLAAAGRVADVHRVVEIEVRGQRRQVVGVVVHVVAVTGLRRTAVPAPVVGDDPVAVLQEEQQLGVPVVSRQRPAVAEHDRLTRTPVLVEDLRAVGRRDRAHAQPPLIGAGCRRAPRTASVSIRSTPRA